MKLVSTNKQYLYVRPAALVIFAAVLLVFPLQWICAWLLAAIIHEVGHCILVIIFGGRVIGACIDIGGFKLYTSTMAGVKSSICSAAGPLAGIMLLFCARQFPRLALCGIFQSVYNLLPIYPLDGGRILRNCLICVSEKTQSIIEDLITAAVAMVIIVITITNSLGLLPIGMVILLVCQYLKNKNYLQRSSGQSTIR
jgi:Zn-dependent protease